MTTTIHQARRTDERDVVARFVVRHAALLGRRDARAGDQLLARLRAGDLDAATDAVLGLDVDTDSAAPVRPEEHAALALLLEIDLAAHTSRSLSLP